MTNPDIDASRSSTAGPPSRGAPGTTSENPRDSSPARVGVVGGSGYTGLELTRLLGSHPGADLVFTTSRSEAGRPSPAAGVAFSEPDEGAALAVDLVFLCLPHGEARSWVERLAGRGPRLVDLTADHRPGSGAEHATGVVYGLNEWNREAVAGASLVANPGCYPTGVLLALLPLVEAGLVDTTRLTVVNAASGVTGAGRSPRTELLFAEVAGNYRAYGWGNRHRHLLEMRALLGSMELLFQPHLLPVDRGILETLVVPVSQGVSAGDLRDAWRARYQGEPAIRVRRTGLPSLAEVVRTDLLALGAEEVADVSAPVVLVGAALDNLGKGAAGQAVQNMNAIFGWPTHLGIRTA
jgi:N-acetyl-gamma-glutamyl-phosphate reductase